MESTQKMTSPDTGHVFLKSCKGLRFDLSVHPDVAETVDVEAFLDERSADTIMFLKNDHGFPLPVAVMGDGEPHTLLWALDADASPMAVALAARAVVYHNRGKGVVIRAHFEEERHVDRATLEVEAHKFMNGLDDTTFGLPGRINVVTETELRSAASSLPSEHVPVEWLLDERPLGGLVTE